jgi:phosphomannomutase
MKMEKDMKKLQNGSDIRGVALAGVAGEEPNLTESEARLLTKGFLRFLVDKTGKNTDDISVAIGRDPRLSGEALAASAADALCERGARTLACGQASTPAMFMATQFTEYSCDGSIMITASHLPWNRNGFKYFTEDGGLDKGDIKKIIEYATDEAETDAFLSAHRDPSGNAEPTKPTPCELMHTYAAHLQELIIDGCKSGTMPLKGLHIVVDAGNGAGGFYAENVLRPLGAKVDGSLFLEPDGHFPNHAPNPEDKAAMQAISGAVLKAEADLGIIFDTDVDRSAAVDENGREIARNGIVAMAAALIADDHPGTTVVTDSITSDYLPEFLESRLGLKHLRFKRGYKNVINKSIELNKVGVDSQLAIETSGHAAYKENFFLDDGAYLATKIVIRTALLKKEGKGISTLIADLKEPAEAIEVRLPISGEDFAETGDKVLTELAAFVESFANGAAVPNDAAHAGCEASGTPALSLVEPNYEGVRISFNKEHGDGWCLLRKSLHDPILPLNMESNSEGGTKIIAKIMKGFLEKYDALDITKL